MVVLEDPPLRIVIGMQTSLGLGCHVVMDIDWPHKVHAEVKPLDAGGNKNIYDRLSPDRIDELDDPAFQRITLSTEEDLSAAANIIRRVW
jgi:hypothetical protein